jgi:hypothetical protein
MTATLKRKLSAGESERARADLRKLFEPTARMRAHANFESARGEYHAATLALMRLEPGCEARADRALKMLNEAREALQRIEDDEGV